MKFMVTYLRGKVTALVVDKKIIGQLLFKKLKKLCFNKICWIYPIQVNTLMRFLNTCPNCLNWTDYPLFPAFFLWKSFLILRESE